MAEPRVFFFRKDQIDQADDETICQMCGAPSGSRVVDVTYLTAELAQEIRSDGIPTVYYGKTENLPPVSDEPRYGPLGVGPEVTLMVTGRMRKIIEKAAKSAGQQR